MTRRRAAIALAATGLALAGAAPAGADQTATQRFFSARLQADRDTSREVRDLLHTNQGFVDRSVSFRDLTGDRKADAVVRVQSGGATGAIALYVLSTDSGRRGSGLRVVFRSQELQRAQTRIRDGVLRYRSARPQPGEELCCPSVVAESRLRWRERRHRFEVAERREVAPVDPWGV
ncbi:MAG: hypothetical protein ACRDK0_02310 [Solirubrobacteraceae bacterium]